MLGTAIASIPGDACLSRAVTDTHGIGGGRRSGIISDNNVSGASGDAASSVASDEEVITALTGGTAY